VSFSLVGYQGDLDQQVVANPSIANTEMGTAYEPVFNYNATAGVGQFNGSYARDYIGNLQNNAPGYPYSIVPYWIQATVNDLIISPLHSVASKPVPVAACAAHGSSCDSYLLPGGLLSSSPWPPTDHPSATVIRFSNAPSIQFDFYKEIGQGIQFRDGDCSIYGNRTSLIGIKFCISESQAFEGSFSAGRRVLYLFLILTYVFI
jgi:hypothetical protein